MTNLQGLILGLLQGLAEFLPISSSGHLLLMQRIFGIQEGLLTFNVVVHIGTLVPVLIIYYSRVKSLIKNPFQKLMFLLAVGTLPAVFVALFFGDFVDQLFTGNFLGIGFIITSIFLLITDYTPPGKKGMDKINFKDALFIGVIQAIAIMPGISRSGSTITGAVARDIDREAAANFSFMLAIPAIMGAAVLEISHIISGASQMGTIFSAPMFVGFAAAMVSGFFAIKIMLKLIVSSKLKYFAYYMFAVGVLILFDQHFTNLIY